MYIVCIVDGMPADIGTGETPDRFHADFYSLKGTSWSFLPEDVSILMICFLLSLFFFFSFFPECLMVVTKIHTPIIPFL